ncbi:sporulation initiation inhibitor Soj [Orenia metallireducens]|jgi:chromosome partitioning protein|uniref:Sporulation initiation inhibitor protein Soj n=1 Tax=Orenia metallireducens TaxID=1413210 RepID=A0A1C0ACT7_9FIRM|nr:ParA family protein [Orenia metallireducens]OCL28447.1 sporulation initiation inhibitor Soj [Orenia metallireducens]
MSKTIAIVNQKGGVGKSTTTVNLGSYLAELGKRVLLLDIDPQGNATSGVGVDKSKIEDCIYGVLIEGKKISEIMKNTLIEGLDIVPATLELAGAEIELVSSISREYKVKQAINEVKEDYDFILIDCPPSLGLLTLNSLAAADSVLIPIQCEYYALEGLSQLLSTIELIKGGLNPDIDINGVLLTMYDSRTNLSEQVSYEVKEHFGEIVYKTVIPRNVRLSEAPSFGEPINIYDKTSAGAKAYLELAKEVMVRV